MKTITLIALMLVGFVGQAQNILLVYMDPMEDFSCTYSAINSIGFYPPVGYGLPDSTELNSYDLIIMLLAEEANYGITFQDGVKLVNYLNNGNALFVIGESGWENIFSPSLKNTLGVDIGFFRLENRFFTVG